MRDNIGIILIMLLLVSLSFASMYYGYHHPEIYMPIGVDSWRMESSVEINIRNICAPDPLVLRPIWDKTWCIA